MSNSHITGTSRQIPKIYFFIFFFGCRQLFQVGFNPKKILQVIFASFALSCNKLKIE